MKFILHNLRMIWARLSNSGWVLAELFLVFIVMWFLCDSLGCMKYTFYRPLGYDIDHVYRLTTVQGGESRDTALLDADKYLNILKRLGTRTDCRGRFIELLEFAYEWRK